LLITCGSVEGGAYPNRGKMGTSLDRGKGGKEAGEHFFGRVGGKRKEGALSKGKNEGGKGAPIRWTE